ncbi:dihydroorotase [Thiolapillus brandeum]|uniref:Dihydroorotase n=1 Tax=Thiolapillus brandeum TaxID=1076588 RepID=A0A7U6JHY1_9GAMM|nr:dihydroorotase [Thiolapillus brandeum]BAO44198.1 dihydroorotase [Thiolapillus brandeum]
MSEHIVITRPDDWHLHLRDAEVLQDIVPHTAERFGRAVVMPNLKPPVTTAEQAVAYRERILKAVPAGMKFDPLMTLYLTDNTPGEEIHKAKESGVVKAVKYYPAGATTNSDSGVTDIRRVYPVLKILAREGMPLLVHGEVTDPKVDMFDREAAFIERVLLPLLNDIPSLKIVFEHITTREAVELVKRTPERLGATITPQHLLMNRNAIFQGGLNPHHYCLPVLKREEHRQALVEAATSGDPRFFLGTDSAPHARSAKESSCGCAGMYSAHAAIEFYAQVFDEAGAMNTLEAFASFHGADFYGLPRNQEKITLFKEPWQVPEKLRFGGGELVPLGAGQVLSWQLK